MTTALNGAPKGLRRVAVLSTALLLSLSLLPATAKASPPSAKTEAPGMAPVRPDALTEALDQGRISPAEYALHRARSLVRLEAVRDEFGTVHRADAHSATLILRDLALRLGSLSGEAREVGAGLLQRPTRGGPIDGILDYTRREAPPVDSAHFRIHYVDGGPDRSTPSYVNAISGVMEEVWSAQVTQMGWRAPRSDANASANGGNALFDVYLGEIGSAGYYGYCSSDPNQFRVVQHAYCVLDNDFAPEEFGNVINGMRAARVTAAHEFNHAIQLAYDVTDDAWLMEGTATWMEDQVYDDINDNYQYLPGSPMGRPRTPADTWTSGVGPDEGFQYGTFIWLRYLSEKHGDPDIVRRIWEKTAESGVYSVEAIEAVVGGEAAFADSFADFAARNAKPSLFYEEGAAYESFVVPRRTTSFEVSSTAVLGRPANSDHLTSRYISFTPGDGVGAVERLTVAVNMGPAPMQEARLVTLAPGMPMTVDVIALTPDGEGHLDVNFGGAEEVVLVLTNASNRMRCGFGVYSCNGSGLDDDLAYTYSATIGTEHLDPGDPRPPAIDTDAPRVSGLKVRPNPVRRGRTADIVFRLGEPASVRVTIFKAGRRVLSGGDSFPAGTGVFRWSIGRRTPTGKYVVKLRARDSAGNSSRAKTSVRIVSG